MNFQSEDKVGFYNYTGLGIVATVLSPQRKVSKVESNNPLESQFDNRSNKMFPEILSPSKRVEQLANERRLNNYSRKRNVIRRNQYD